MTSLGFEAIQICFYFIGDAFVENLENLVCKLHSDIKVGEKKLNFNFFYDLDLICYPVKILNDTN